METYEFEQNPPSSDEVLASMFSDALGREVTPDSFLTAGEELTAGAEVQGRLDGVTEQMRKMRDGEEIDLGMLMDSKAQLALLEIWIESRDK